MSATVSQHEHDEPSTDAPVSEEPQGDVDVTPASSSGEEQLPPPLTEDEAALLRHLQWRKVEHDNARCRAYDDARREQLRAAEDERTAREREHDAWIAEIRAQLERDQRDRELHAASCKEKWCSRCGRPACQKCGNAPPVNNFIDDCFACAAADYMRRSIDVPTRYLDAYEHAKTRVKSAAAREAGAKACGARVVVALGKAGSGKSTLLGAMVNQRVRRRLTSDRRAWDPILWTSAFALGRARATHRLGEGEAELVERAMEIEGLLVIDDLGAESARDSEVIGEIIHARHDADRGIWVSTGLAIEDLPARYSGGVVRRLLEGAVVIDCDAGRNA